MPRPSDVGNKVFTEDAEGFRANTVIIQMWIKGPKGQMFIYDNFWFNQRPEDNIEHKCKAIRSFMEFNNG